MIEDLKNKVVLITGASTGIGAAAAIAFGQNGAKVAVHYDKSKAEAEKVAAQVEKAGGKALLVGSDVTDSAICKQGSGGAITTPFHDRYSTPQLLESFKASIPMNRLGGADECAGAFLFLASEQLSGYKNYKHWRRNQCSILPERLPLSAAPRAVWAGRWRNRWQRPAHM